MTLAQVPVTTASGAPIPGGASAAPTTTTTPSTSISSPSSPSPSETMSHERTMGEKIFDTRKMSVLLEGGDVERLKRKERFMMELSRDPAFRLDDIHDLSKDALRERTMEKFSSMVHWVQSEKMETFTQRMAIVSVADPGFWTRFGVSFGLFLGALRSGATPAQFNYWVEKGILTLKGMVGCFGMTELAHGSNVAGLETTATFDRTTDEFVIHTPHVGATKWWIGGAAQTATHCAVFAQLVVDGKKHGVKTFIVQLRDPKTFTLKTGIMIGDIGKKMGRDGIDNGYIQFTNVRVPRAHMLMKHSQVSREGIVTEPPLAQLTYGALLSGRISMVTDSSNTAKKALTIAVRYAAVRRQFASGPKATVETQLLDYPIHQRRLLPLVAQAVAIGFTASILQTMYDELTRTMETLEPGDAKLGDALEKLKETHATSAGLKAFCTWSCLDTIERARQACGGHGYSAYSSLPGIYNDFAVQCTWEGDNTILSLQSGRALIGSWNDAVRGRKLAPGVAYMADPTTLKAQSTGKLDLEDVDRGWACVAANVVRKAAEDFAGFLKQGLSKDQAMERCSQSRFVAAKMHTIGYIYRLFKQACEQAPAGPERDVLVKLCRLYGLWQVEEQGAAFLKYGYFTGAQLDKVQSEVDSLCQQIRACAIPLIDSFALSDHIVNSPLGRYDGDVYVHYFNQVRASNPTPKVHPYFERLIKPLFERTDEDEDNGEVDAKMGFSEEFEELKKEREATIAANGKNKH